MQSRHFLAALLCVGPALPALAQEGVQTFANEILSTRPRAEVRAELDRARLAGELDRRNHTYGAFDRALAAPNGVTRGEVLAEYERARMAGELERRNYSHGTGPAARSETTVARSFE